MVLLEYWKGVQVAHYSFAQFHPAFLSSHWTSVVTDFGKEREVGWQLVESKFPF